VLKSASQRVRTISLVAVVTMVVALVSVALASAISAPIHISGTAGEGVYIRPQPNTSQAPVGWMPEGASPDYNCFVWGQNVSGVPIWFNVNYNGVTGYYASFYDDSIYHSNEELTAKYGVPLCGSAPAASPPPSSPPPAASPPGGSTGGGGSPIINAGYNRDGTVAWALMHAKDNQPRLAMCAWFVSHALWAGGLPMVPGVWSDQGNYSRLGGGTAAEWQVPNLKDFLFSHYSSTYTNITANLKTNAVPQAERGDLIFYDWEKNPGEGITHVAIMVGMAPGNYPEVAEMGQFDFGLIHGIINRINPINSGYQKRGWTWSQVSRPQVWLQDKYPHMKAYLFHFNGGSLGDLA
jgi:hypothetical protein